MADPSPYTTWGQSGPPRMPSPDTLQYPPLRKPSGTQFEDRSVHAPAGPSSNAPTPAPPGLVRGSGVALANAQNARTNLQNPSNVNPGGASVRTGPVAAPPPPPTSAHVHPLTAHPLLEHYSRTMYTARNNFLEVEARDYRLGLLVLSLHELAAERNRLAKFQDELVQQVGSIVQQMESVGLALGPDRERLWAMNRVIDEQVQVNRSQAAKWQFQSASANNAGGASASAAPSTSASAAGGGAGTGFGAAPPLYQERYASDGSVVIDIPLAKRAQEDLSVEEIQQVGRSFVEAPIVQVNNYLKHHLPPRRM